MNVFTFQQISGLLYNDGHNIVFNTSALRQLNGSKLADYSRTNSLHEPSQANSTRKRHPDGPFSAELVEVSLMPVVEDAPFDNTLASSPALIGPPEEPGAAGNSISLEESPAEPAETGPWPRVQISGAELAYTFTFEAFYLRFGKDDASGSEHQVNSNPYAGELQLLAYNSDLYKSYTEASTQPHGILFVAALMTLKPDDNSTQQAHNQAASSYLEANILSRLHEINHKDHYALIDSLNLSALLPETGQFITYQGSLSKPGCHESAQWFLLNTPLYITRTNVSIIGDFLLPGLVMVALWWDEYSTHLHIRCVYRLFGCVTLISPLAGQ